MMVNGKSYRSLWESDDARSVYIIDQRWLPHQFVIEQIHTVEQMATAISEMHLRGAVLIGAAAAYGMVLAAQQAMHRPDFDQFLRYAAQMLQQTRPTAINLQWAIEQQLQHVNASRSKLDIHQALLRTARSIVETDLQRCYAIGEIGFTVIQELAQRKGTEPINILTHCNAGWLGCIDYGTATAPLYRAHQQGISIHVWVDETRPWNQGSRLTAWELGQQGIAHTIIADNAAAHLMQRGMVDLVIIGADRVTANGDVANKIGSLEKAICAQFFNIPFYVAVPTPSIHWEIHDGVSEIPIEERSAEEIHFLEGWDPIQQQRYRIRLTPSTSTARNWAFDVTPAALITGLITEYGIFPASSSGIAALRNHYLNVHSSNVQTV